MDTLFNAKEYPQCFIKVQQSEVQLNSPQLEKYAQRPQRILESHIFGEAIIPPASPPRRELGLFEKQDPGKYDKWAPDAKQQFIR